MAVYSSIQQRRIASCQVENCIRQTFDHSIHQECHRPLHLNLETKYVIWQYIPLFS